MTTTSDSTPTPSNYHTNFEFPSHLLLSQTSVSSLKVDCNATDNLCSLTPKLSNKSYSALSVDDVDRLRQIIKNMKSKRNDGIQIKSSKSDTNTNTNTNETFLVCHTPNLSYNKYECDAIYKYKSYEELMEMTTHSTNNNKLYEQRWMPKVRNTNANTNNKSLMPWSHYKDITIKRLKHPLLNNKPAGKYFILGEFANNLIDQDLNNSFLQNLRTLECDALIEYDLREKIYNKYLHLHHKTNEFGKQNTLHKYMAYPLNDIDVNGGFTPPRYYAPNDPYDSDSDNGMTPRIPNLYDLKSNESMISLFNIPSPMNESLYNLRSTSIYSETEMNESPSNTETQSNNTKYKPFFNFDFGCMQYKCMENKEIHTINKNTAVIHDIIDPNKNINDNHLWVPSVFDCSETKPTGFDGLIKSQIVGLDYVKYSNLYENIASIFKKMQFMFENVLNRTLTSSEKIIVSVKKCVLQKYGDEYEDIMHKEGMGENIQCIGLYFAQIYNRKNIRLQISLNDKNNKLMQSDVNISNGSCVVFNNECYSCIQRIVHNKKNNKPIYFTVLSFYLININEINILCSNSQLLNINLIYNWPYIISYWLRYYCSNTNNNHNNITQSMSNSWMNGLIYLYLFGIDYDEYIYDRRQNIVCEKQKAIIKPNESFNVVHHLHSLLNDININQ